MFNKYSAAFLFVLASASITNVFSQNIGINTTGSAANASSMLDVDATDKGVLIPRVSLVDITNGTSPINTPATALMVYNINASVVGGAGLGFYFWSGTAWVKIATGNFGSTLTNGRIWIGNASNVPTEQQITGDISIANTGVAAIQANAVNSAKISDGTVTNADLANMDVLSIKGNATNASAVPTDITAGTDGFVLRRSGATLGFGTLSNASLANSSVTVSPGTGMSGGGTVALGGTITLTNAGVTSITGTTNRIIASASTGAITLSTPQDIHTGANPTFNSVTAPNDFFGRINIEDTRATNALPATYQREVHFEFKQLAAIAAPGSGTYGGLMTIAPWTDVSGNNNHQLFFNDGGIFYRSGTPGSAWNAWAQVLTGNQISGTVNYVPKYTAANTLGNSQIYDNGTNVGVGTAGPGYKLDVNGSLRVVTTTNIQGGLFTEGIASTLYGASASIYANNANLSGGGIMISDDGGFVDYNDGPVTFVGSTGLRIAGTGAAGTGAYLRINGLAGTNNRVVRADANGTLTVGLTTCPAGFTSIDFTASRLCIYNDAFTTNWNNAVTRCYSSFNGASLCTHNQVKRACGIGGYVLTTSRWLADRTGDDAAINVNGTDCTNFDGNTNANGTTLVGSYCCLEYWK